ARQGLRGAGADGPREAEEDHRAVVGAVQGGRDARDDRRDRRCDQGVPGRGEELRGPAGVRRGEAADREPEDEDQEGLGAKTENRKSKIGTEGPSVAALRRAGPALQRGYLRNSL